MTYDIIIIGSGPGGYVAAIRAAQLGMKVGVVERAELGGVCLNWGCIPAKALLKSAQVFSFMKYAGDYGIDINDAKPDFRAMIKRSRVAAEKMSKGIQFLFKKNKIDVIEGTAKLSPDKKVEVIDTNFNKKEYSANHILIATGARSKELPSLKQDGKKVIGYREALILPKQPKSMIVVGAGVIGVEFAYFYNSIGTEVTIIECLPGLLPNEDEDVGKELARSFRKKGMKILTNTSVESVHTSEKGCEIKVKTSTGEEMLKTDVILSAVGISPNIEGIGLEETGIKTEKGIIKVDEYYKTNVDGYYAIGDIVHGPALAHVASAEGIICVDKIAGKDPDPLDYNNLPFCAYCQPEIASTGYTEKAAKEAGYEIKVGKFPFMASGKANAAGSREGFVKVIFDAQSDKCLGAHMIGDNVTEMIAEVIVARKLETTAHEIIKSVHPHPTMSEAIMDATSAAMGESINL